MNPLETIAELVNPSQDYKDWNIFAEKTAQTLGKCNITIIKIYEELVLLSKANSFWSYSALIQACLFALNSSERLQYSINDQLIIRKAVEILCSISICPFLECAVGLKLNMRTKYHSILEGLSMLEDSAKLSMLFHTTMNMLRFSVDKGFGIDVVSKSSSDIVSAILNLVFSPKFNKLNRENKIYDRKNCCNELTKMIKSNSIFFIQDLIMLQGSPQKDIVNFTSISEGRQMPRLSVAPKWLRSAIGKLLTECLLQPKGFKTVTDAILMSNISSKIIEVCKVISDIVVVFPRGFDKLAYIECLVSQFIFLLMGFKSLETYYVDKENYVRIICSILESSQEIGEAFWGKMSFHMKEESMFENILEITELIYLNLDISNHLGTSFVQSFCNRIFLLYCKSYYCQKLVSRMCLNVLVKYYNQVEGDGLVFHIVSSYHIPTNELTNSSESIKCIQDLVEKLKPDVLFNLFLEILYCMLFSPYIEECRILDERLSNLFKIDVTKKLLCLSEVFELLIKKLHEVILCDNINLIHSVEILLERILQLWSTISKFDSNQVGIFKFLFNLFASILDIYFNSGHTKLEKLRNNIINLELVVPECLISAYNDLLVHVKTHSASTVYDNVFANDSSPSLEDGLFCDLCSHVIPLRVRAISELCKILKNDYVYNKRHKILDSCLEGIKADDSFLYLAAVNGLVCLVDIETDKVLPKLLTIFVENYESLSSDIIIKISEVLVKTILDKKIIVDKYHSVLLNALIHHTKHKDDVVRSSSWCCIGNLLKCLGYALLYDINELLSRLNFAIKYEKQLVRRAVLYAVFMMFEGCQSGLNEVTIPAFKELYSVLKTVYVSDEDSICRLHAELALKKVNEHVYSYLTLSTKPKDIKVFGLI